MQSIFFTNDLFFGSQVISAAKAKGGAVAMVGSLAALRDAVAGGDVRLVILDLNTAGCDPAECVAAVRAAGSASREAKILAYAPHVMEAKLAAAKDAGCDQVLTRGQFSSQLPTLF